MDKVRAGVIGLGQRTNALIKQLFNNGELSEVVGICDLFADRVEEKKQRIKDKYGKDVWGTTDPYELIDHPDVNTVIICSAWESHIPLSIYAMKAGKAVGCEVAGAYSVEQCWELVKTYEKTKTPIMMLENVCYGRRPLMLLNMARQGFFGKIMHVDGAYEHDIRDEIADGVKIRHYRLRNYLNRNCENYPTHELGPLAKILNINNGNRFVKLSSFASKARGLEEFIKTERADVAESQGLRFKQGDVITTVITCANGETIRLNLITSTPTYGSNRMNIHGTKAFYHEDTDSFCENGHSHDKWQTYWDNAKDYEEKWLDPTWKQFLADGVQGGHGGMDYLCMRDFIHCLVENKPMPIDVYDMAAWMAVTPLSENSIANGGKSVEFPDFTNGRWLYSDAF